MKRSASALEAAGNTIDESLALIASANTVVQDPEKVGTTLKTVSMYLRAAKTEAEAAGESTEGMVESVSKLREELLKLTNNKVDIMLDDDTFKSSFEILKEISQVWDQLTDVTQANILEKLAGKRNSNVVAAILNNFDIAEKALVESQNAAGSAMAENEKYLDSITGKLNQLTASWEQLSTGLLSNEFLKTVIDGLRGILDAFNNLNEATNGASSAILALVSAFVVARAVFASFAFKAKDSTSVISAIVDAFSAKKISNIKIFSLVLTALKKKLVEIGATFTITSAASNSLAKSLAFAAAEAAPLIGILVAIPAVIGLISAAYKKYKEANPSLDDLKNNLEESKARADELKVSLDENNERIAELQSKLANGGLTFVEQDELNRLKESTAQLRQQYKVAAKLAELDEQKVIDKAAEEAHAYLTGRDEYDAIAGSYYNQADRNRDQDALSAYREAKRLYNEEASKSSPNSNKLKEYKQDMNDALSIINEAQKKTQEWLTELYKDPENNAGAIQQLEAFSDQIYLTIGGTDAMQDVFQRFWETNSKRGMSAAEAFAKFKDQLETAGVDTSKLTEADFTQMWESLGKAAQAATEMSASFKTAADWVTELSDNYDVLSQAQSDMDETGKVSASTLEKILTKYPSLQKYLVQTADGYTLTKGALDAYIASQRQECQLALNEAQTAAQKLVDAEALKQKGINTTTMSVKQQLLAMAELYRSQAYTTGDNSYYLKAWDMKDAIQRLTDAEQSMKDFESVASTVRPSGGSPSKSSKSSTDKYKEAVENRIAILKHQLAMEKITSAQYYDALEFIEKTYYKDSKAHMTKYASEIRSLDEELFNGRRQLAEDWLNDQEKLADKAAAGGSYAKQEKLLEGMVSKVKKMMADAYAYGLTEASDYVQELQDKLSSLQDDLLSAVQSPYEKYISYMDDFDLWGKAGSEAFDAMASSIGRAEDAVVKLSKQLKGVSKLDALKEQLKAIDQLYKDGKLSWEKYVSAHNNVAKNIYDTQKDSLQTILDLTMEMIKQEAEDQVEAIEKQVEAYQKIIDLKKQLLQDAADEEDHEDQVAEKVKEIAELQSKIAQLSLDDSREANAKRAALAEELAKKQKELDDLQKDYALDQTLDALDKSQEAFEDEKDAEKKAAEESVDSWAKLYEKAIQRIDGDWDGLYRDLQKYEAIHRDSIDGPNSLVTAWQNATSAMREYNNSFEDAYNGAPNYGLNPNASQSPEAQAILKQMQANSAMAKAMGTTVVDGRDLHAENQALAEQYYQLTGQRLVYDNGWRLDYSGGSPAYDVPAPGEKTQPKDTASGGNAYKATVAQYDAPPSGTLKEGSSGAGVKWLQYYLKQLGFFNYAVDGYFYSRTKDALKRFQAMAKLSQDGIYGPKTRAALPNYHTGGIVGNAGAINDTEVLALLKKGEWVLDDTRKQNLKAMFAGLKQAASGMMGTSVMSRMQTMQPAMATGGGDTFAPHIEVAIQHNGQMTDKDAKKYGNMVANTAIEQLRTAFVKRGKT